MSVYQIVPSPDLSTREQNFATWENGFSESEISSIKDIGEKRIITEATVGGSDVGQVDPEIRKSLTSWLRCDDETGFIYDRLGYIANQLNGQFFDFDLYGFVEDLQYTVYNSDGGHYTWHIDKGIMGASPRKLTLVLQLSDPSEYEGGDLEFFVSPEPTKGEKKKGLIYAFPSYILHRVTPVTAGTRKTLVVWLSGKKFR